MRLAGGFVLFVLWWLAGPVLALGRTAEEYERVELRVTELRPAGIVVVDRGAAEGLKKGDLVLFHPRAGKTEAGNVLSTEARSALVELHDRGLVLALGTRGEVMVPVSRLAPEPPPPAATGAEQPAAPRAEPTQEIRWQNQDEDHTPDQPLLAQMRPVRPEERDPVLTGRVYVSGDGTLTSEDDRSDAFLRAGGSFEAENLFGRGGALLLDAEVNYRVTNLPDEDDESFSKLRLDRASYVEGGTRYDPLRWEAGRFLQYGIVELGVLDGVEVGWRRKNGDAFGFSLGFMPEPDADFSTGEDFQLAAYYHWALDQEDHLSLDGAFQKTLHDGDSDRDLLITRLRYAPPDAWNVYATAWVDYYGSSDRVKGQGIELTQALVLASRRWEDGSAANVSFTHQRIPELERDEFQLLDDDELENNRDDRLSFYGWWMVGEQRMHGELGAWSDEEEEGGDATFGVDFAELLLERSHLDLTGFGALGEFSRVVGGQLTFGQYLPDGRWDLFYEFSHHNVDDFPNDSDDILQHRLRAGRDWNALAGWNVSLYTEGRLYDDEGSLSIGFYLQRGY